jgi:hypothetical protein
MPKYRIVVDFDGLREDGEYLDGRAVEAKDAHEARLKLEKDFKIELDSMTNWGIWPIKPGTEDEVDWDA